MNQTGIVIQEGSSVDLIYFGMAGLFLIIAVIYSVTSSSYFLDLSKIEECEEKDEDTKLYEFEVINSDHPFKNYNQKIVAANYLEARSKIDIECKMNHAFDTKDWTFRFITIRES